MLSLNRLCGYTITYVHIVYVWACYRLHAQLLHLCAHTHAHAHTPTHTCTHTPTHHTPTPTHHTHTHTLYLIPYCIQHPCGHAYSPIVGRHPQPVDAQGSLFRLKTTAPRHILSFPPPSPIIGRKHTVALKEGTRRGRGTAWFVSAKRRLSLTTELFCNYRQLTQVQGSSGNNVSLLEQKYP